MTREGLVTWTSVNYDSDPMYVHFEDGRSVTLHKGQSLIVSEPCVLHVHSCGWDKIPFTPQKSMRFSPRQASMLPVVPMSNNKRRKIILNYPPVSSVWHLPFGIAQLAACLKERGHEVRQRYGHIIGLEHILREYGGDEAEGAIATIRDPKSDILALYNVQQSLKKISKSVPTRDKFVVYGNNANYVSADNDGSIEGILCAIENRKSNMWYRYFAEVEIPLAEDCQPDIYGVSIADERHLVQGFILASLVKEALPKTLVVIGGNFFARTPDAFKTPEFAKLFDHCDAIVWSEGFEPICKLADSLDPSSTPGTAWRNGDKVIVNPPSVDATSFESLPTPIFDGGARQWSPDDVYPLYTMSNCPMQCGFCAIAAGSDTFLGRSRMMSPQRVAEHMQKLDGHRFDIINELMPVPYQLALGAELKKIGHEATWQCYLTVTNDLADPAKCKQLYDAGCRGVQLGLETLSRETLLREKKGWNHPEHYVEILRNLKDAGIQTHVFLLLGLPGQPLHHDLRWLAFLEEHGDLILTIKSGRYRLARKAPEEQFGTHSSLIKVAESIKPLRLNRDFQYTSKFLSRSRVEAVRDILEEACRRHWAYQTTTILPWWINRGRYSWNDFSEMAKVLPREEPVRHIDEAVKKMERLVFDELGRKETFSSFEDLVAFSHTI
ncbi:MAG: radical SAM protein [Candidatus Pacebacteria bacterium]|nr:radical SAM protein [Candidatus Paceibacterota bacterium]